MACERVGRSRKLGCKTSIKAGIKRVGFLNYVETATQQGLILEADKTWNGGGFTASGTASIYVFSLKNDGNTFTEEVSGDSNTRNILYNGTLTLTMPGLGQETHAEVMKLAVANPHIFVELNSGKTLLIGAQSGAELTGGSITTGGAATDMQGYTLTFTTQEGALASFIGATGSTLYHNAIDMTNAIEPS